MRTRLLLAASLLTLSLAAAPVATAAPPEALAIDVQLILSGNLQASTTVGSFLASGAIDDGGQETGSGRFAGLGHLKTGEPNSLHSSMRLVGAHGTIEVDLVGTFGRLPAPLAWGDGTWVVSGGSGAYADLHGRGSWTAVADFRDAFAQVGPPRVTFDLEGTVN